jgi:capsid protein
MLQAWRFFRVRRGWLIQAFCQPLYELLIDELVATGKVNLPGYAENRAAYCAAHWIGDGRGAMDELKEAQAMAARVALGVSNLDMETMQSSGKSYEEVLRGRAKEIRLQDELGVRDSTRDPLVQQAVFTPVQEEKPAETPSKTDENA